MTVVPRGSFANFMTACRAVVLVLLVSGCSSLPNALNPVEWYKGASDMVTGSSRPQIASPKTVQAEPAQAEAAQPDGERQPPRGLAADRTNSKYASAVRREVTPTKPLARRQQPAPTAVAAASETKQQAEPKATPQPAAQPTPTQVAEAPRQAPVIEGKAPAMRDAGPTAPPGRVDMNPPPRPDIPERVAAPKMPRQLGEQYQRRLAESAAVAPSGAQPVQVPAGAPAGVLAAAPAEAGFELRPPKSMRGQAPAAKGMLAPPPVPAASFQVATVTFETGSSALSREDVNAIAEVAKLYRKNGGVIRVVGRPPEPLYGGFNPQGASAGLEASMQRANAVARELARRGVPAEKLFVGAEAGGHGADPAGARVFLDY